MSKPLQDYTKEELIEAVKSLRQCKKFGLVWEDKLEDVAVQCEKQLPIVNEVTERAIKKAEGQPTNLIIEGDNYHALSVLNYTHAGKIDVIYIDPPYNTEDTTWIYNNDYVDKNDMFRHSKWLSFMEKRLVLAKGLLKSDGVLICAIDKNEQAHLCVMLEELFPDYEIHTITVVHNPRGVQGKNFSYTHESAVFVIPRGKKSIGRRKISDADVAWRNLRDNGGESLRTDARNCFYPMIVKEGKVVDFGDVVDNSEHPLANTVQTDGSICVYPVDGNGIERKWRYARQSVEKIKDLLRAKKVKGVWQIEIGKNFGTYRTVWQDARYDSNEFGTKLINKIVPGNGFDFPKSLWNTYDCLYSVIGEKKDAVVLDYFAGSGTTGHAVMEMNKEDGGNRQHILVSSNEGNIPTIVTYPRIKGVIDGYAGVAGIPANVRYFKTDFVDKDGTLDKLKREISPRCADMIRIREGAYETVLDTEMLKVYANQRGLTAVVFDRFELEKYLAEIEKLETDAPIHLYVFSYDKDGRADEMPDDLKHEYINQPIPEGVLEVYSRIFKERGKNA